MSRTLVGPAPTVAPAAWASVRLIEGQAEANTWHVDSTTSRAQLTVGSAETCAWRITVGAPFGGGVGMPRRPASAACAAAG